MILSSLYLIWQQDPTCSEGRSDPSLDPVKQSQIRDRSAGDARKCSDFTLLFTFIARVLTIWAWP